MSDWTTLRKGGTHLYLEYGHTFTKNLFGYDSKICTGHDAEIQLDLTPNLRTKNKQSNEYIDARDLADGAVARPRREVYAERLRAEQGDTPVIAKLRARGLI